MSRPDLLYTTSPRREEVRGLSEALTFGFARGVDSAHISKLCAPPLGETTFRRECFVEDLFLDDLVHAGFPLFIGDKRIDEKAQFFKEILIAPPRRHDDVLFRQEIFKELVNQPERLELLETAYSSLLSFRDALCGSEHYSDKTVGVRRRIDILSALRRGMDDLVAATSSSQSGLSRAARWLDDVNENENYRRLVQLLDFEDGRTVIETRLQIGYDGDLRCFDIIGVKELDHRPFPRGKLRRFFRQLVSLLKGYRFSEEDVMSQVLDQVFSSLEQEVVILLGLIRHLEFYLRGMGFRARAEERGLGVCLPTFTDGPSKSTKLLGLFNPWLCVQGGSIVPCDIVSGNTTSGDTVPSHLVPNDGAQDEGGVTTIITGPNSGGKTRLLQSLAVTQLLAQGGLFVPAKEAEVAQVEHLFLSLLEHANANQTEGRLGLELVRIRQVFETSGPKALVIMDELCSGTNPSEGERIFEMVLGLFRELGPQVVISTHFLDFAARLYGESRKGLAFLQVEIGERDVPTYQFVAGVAETSLARNTAARLGVTREELLRLIVDHKRSV